MNHSTHQSIHLIALLGDRRLPLLLAIKRLSSEVSPWNNVATSWEISVRGTVRSFRAAGGSHLFGRLKNQWSTFPKEQRNFTLSSMDGAVSGQSLTDHDHREQLPMTTDFTRLLSKVSQVVASILSINETEEEENTPSQEVQALRAASQWCNQTLLQLQTINLSGIGPSRDAEDLRQAQQKELMESLQNIRECLESLSQWDIALQVEDCYHEFLLLSGLRGSLIMSQATETKQNHLDSAASLHRQGKILIQLSQPMKAQILYQQALAEYKNEYGIDEWQSEIGQVLISMAGIPYHRNQFELSMNLLREAESHFLHHGKSQLQPLSENDGKQPHIGLIRCLEHQGLLYRVMQNFHDALEMYERALTTLPVVAQQVPEDSRSAWISEKRLALEMDQADMYIALDLYKCAEELYKSILQRRSNQRENEQTPNTEKSGTALEGVIMHSLGKIHAQQQEYHKAKDELIQAVEIKQRLMGELHPEVATSLNALGAVYAVLGVRHKALECFQQSLLIARMSAKDGDSDPEVLYALRNISVLKGEDIPKWGAKQDD